MNTAKKSDGFDLERYLSNGVEKLVKDMIKAAAFHPRESLFMAQYALSSKKASGKRQAAESRGEHIPPFLIASITEICNLQCAGCYAHSLNACGTHRSQELSAEEWARVFEEARDLGIGFILLAGGEPFVRKDVIEKAALFPEILFPVFTNGTMTDNEYFTLFDRHRNLIPILSIEGGKEKTDARRGEGIYAKARAAMQTMKDRRIAFGASVTVTAQNIEEVTSADFVKALADTGCKAIIYVEFVPADESLQALTLSQTARETLAARIEEFRMSEEAPLMLSFPGDEKGAGGCLAAGRGFFHINAHGGAEPCPFSPYSDISVRTHSLKEALQSELFRSLQENGFLAEEHTGGCVLYENRLRVEALLKNGSGV